MAKSIEELLAMSDRQQAEGHFIPAMGYCFMATGVVTALLNAAADGVIVLSPQQDQQLTGYQTLALGQIRKLEPK